MRTSLKLFTTLGLFLFILIPFGGQVLSQTICLNGTALLVGPPSPGFYMYTPGITTLFSWFAPFVGNYLLGLASPGGFCYLGVTGFPTTGTVIMMGTSGGL